MFSQHATTNGRSAYTPFSQPSSSQMASNYTSASHYATPFYYELERDPRHWLGGLGSGAMSGYGGYAPFSYGGGSLFSSGGGIETAIVCLLVVVGIGVIGLPMLLLLFSVFSNNNMSNAPSAGFNFIPPTSTTTVTGRRRKRSPEPHLSDQLLGRLSNRLSELSSMTEVTALTDQLLGNIRPELREKASMVLKNFAAAEDKMEYIKKLIQ